MGINIVKMKLLAFALGAFFAGMAGAFFAGKMETCVPGELYLFESVIILCMVVLGGMGSDDQVRDTGAVVLIILPESQGISELQDAHIRRGNGGNDALESWGIMESYKKKFELILKMRRY